MIINIKGCSGSGKSTIVRTIMDQYEVKEPVFIEGRKRPVGYELHSCQPEVKPLFVIGHYETDCGGCDTIKLMDDVFTLIREKHEKGLDVLFEGLLLTADVNRSKALYRDGIDIITIGLDTELDVCLESIDKRRRTAWLRKCLVVDTYNVENPTKKKKEYPAEPEPINPYHTTNKWKQMKNVLRRIEDAGMDVRHLNRDESVACIKKEFGL